MHLRRHGHEVLVLAPGVARPAEPHVRIVGRSVRVPFNGSVAPICMQPASSAAVKAALRRFAPDVVHAHEPFAPSTSMFAVLHAEAPVIATFHAYVGPDSFHARLLRIVAPLLRPVWSRLSLRLAVSDAAASGVASYMGEATPPRVVPNGVNVERFAGAAPAELPPGRKLLLVGRLEPRKGFAVALRAFTTLAARYPDLLLVVVGDGKEREAVRELEPGVRERVLMHNRVSDAELPAYYAAADVFFAPATSRESFGVVLVEAMAAGVPIVASDLLGYRGVVRPNLDGLLVPPADPDAAVEAIAPVLERPTVAQQLGRAGQLRARSFSWERIVMRLEAAYDEVVGAHRTREAQLAASRYGMAQYGGR